MLDHAGSQLWADQLIHHLGVVSAWAHQLLIQQNRRGGFQCSDMLGAGLRIAEVGTRQLQLGHVQRQLGFIGEQLGEGIRVGNRLLAGLFIGTDHLLDQLGLSGGEFLGDAEYAIAVEVEVAIQLARTGLQLAGGHQRIKPGPGVDIATLKGDAAIGVLQVDDFHGVFIQPGFLQALQKEQERIGAFGGGDLLAFQIGQAVDR